MLILAAFHRPQSLVSSSPIPETAPPVQQLHSHLGPSKPPFESVLGGDSVIAGSRSHLAAPLEPVMDEPAASVSSSFLEWYLSFRSLLDILVFVILAGGAGTSASVSGLSTTGRSTARLVVGLGRGWAHKGKVDRDGLIEQLCVVCSFDGSLCLIQCRELDQDVALEDAISILRCFLFVDPYTP
jgi:hypothetical protein